MNGGRRRLREAARKEGLYELTAEQETEIDQQYLKYYNETVTTFLEQYGTDEKGAGSGAGLYRPACEKQPYPRTRTADATRQLCDGYAV
jgi:hypothetical protein